MTTPAQIPWLRAPVLFGTSSFSSKDWVGPFYPKGTRPADFLRLYAARYRAVEIDATYYAVPPVRTVEGWAEKTPDSFVIAAKFPRGIVHGGTGARPDPDRVLDPDLTYPVRDAFLHSMSHLGSRLGPLLIQFPFFSKSAFPSGEVFFERLDHFLGDLPRDFQFAVEIRNKTWLTESFADLCRAHEVALVVTEQAWMPHGDELLSQFDPVTAPFGYVRLLGDHVAIEQITTTWEKEVLDKTDSLRRWAGYLATMLEREVPMLVFANNHYAGHAPATLEKLEALLEESSGYRSPPPPPPRQKESPGPQGTLFS